MEESIGSEAHLWVKLIDAQGELSVKGRAHRRSHSAPLGSPASANSPAIVSQQSASSGRLSPRRRHGSGLAACPQTFQPPPSRHRRAASLSTELSSSPTSRGARAAGRERRRAAAAAGRSAELQEQAMEALHRPPLRRRAEPCNSRGVQATHQTREGSTSPCSGGGRPRTPPGWIVSGGLRGVGVTGARTPPRRSPPRSPVRSSPLRSELSVGKAKEQLPDPTERVRTDALTSTKLPLPEPMAAAATTTTINDDGAETWALKGTGAAPAPTLTTRRSSDSTVGLTDSPLLVPEGLKTDEEDYGGRWRRPARGATGPLKSLSLAGPAPATAAAASAVADGGGGAVQGADAAQRVGGSSTAGGEGSGGTDEMSPCESIGGDATTCAGSFCLPKPPPGRAGGGAQILDARGAAVAGGSGRDGDSRGGMEVESETGLTVVTAAENSAANARVPTGFAATDPPTGGPNVGSLLDAYREPEGHDWGGLEDWHGLPGLQLAGGRGGATIRPRLQAPALIFRAGTVDEGDVLSLHGRPRSRKPEAKSPAKYGPTLTHSSSHEWGAANPQAERHTRSGATTGAEAAVPGLSGGPRASHPRPIRSAGTGVNLCFDGGDAGESGAERGGGGWVSRGGGGGQPLLLSLADLTTAGLQKLLQAEGGSKMFFDPDSQRWVGEEVDLSGFEDPNTSSIGSVAAAAAAAGVGGGTGRPSSPHRSSDSRSPGRAGTPSPRYAQQGGKESPRRLPVQAHRRWSSGEGLQGRAPSSRQASVTLLEGGGGGKAAAGKPGGRKSGHNRRHSVSGPALLSPGITSARLEVPGDGSATSAGAAASRPLSASTGRGFRGRGRSQPDSMASSAASSGGLRSESDTGSVIRLWDDSNNHSDGDRWHILDGWWSGIGSVRRASEAAGGGPSRGGEGGGGGSDPAVPPAARKDLVIGGDQLPKQRLAQVFEGAAYASSDGRASWSSSNRRNDAPPPLGGGERGSPADPWSREAQARRSSSPLGLENSLASESELEASESSDWDQDGDFECLPENQPFTLTLEPPTKFGYSPSLATTTGRGDDSRNPDNDNTDGAAGPTTTGVPSTPESDWPPPLTPELSRHKTAPATTASSPALGHGEAGNFLRWPMKMSTDSSSGGGGGAGGGKKGHNHHRTGTYTDYRADSLGSAAEWDRTLEGDLDVSLAKRPRTPVTSAGPDFSKPKPRPASGGPPRPTPAKRDGKLSPGVPSHIMAASSGCRGPESGGGGGGGSTTGSSPRSAVGIAWEAFKAHGGGESVPATLKAAVTATTIGLEHVRKCTRERLLQEKGKGAGAGKRLSGPVQITLQDLQATPSEDKASLGGSVHGTGQATSPSAGGVAQAASGARFNKEKMCWEGFEEPDLAGFATTDSESESPSRRDRSHSRRYSRSRSTSPFGGATGSNVMDEGLDEDRRRMTASPLGLYLAAAASGAALDSPREGAMGTEDDAVVVAVAGGTGECDVGDRRTPTGGEKGGGAVDRNEATAFLETPAGGAEEDAGWAEGPGNGKSEDVGGPLLAELRLASSATAPGMFSAEPAHEGAVGGACVSPAGEMAVGSPQPGFSGELRVDEGLRPRMESGGGGGDVDVEVVGGGAGGDVGRTPTDGAPKSRSSRSRSSSGASSSDEISDWDKNLNSPSPVSFSEVLGANAVQMPSLVYRMSSPALNLKGGGDKDVTFCVQQGGDAGGRTSMGGAWSVAGGHIGGRPSYGRTPSAGPILFTPASMSLGLAAATAAAAATVVGTPSRESICASITTTAAVEPGTSLPPAVAVASCKQALESGMVAEVPPSVDGGLGEAGGAAGVTETCEGSTEGVPCVEMGPASGRPDAEVSEASTAVKGEEEATAVVGAVATPTAGAGGGGGGRAEMGGKAAGRRVHGMVSRRIYGGPMEQGGEQDGRASMSHKTKSTEDYSIDDWGADFVGGIVLTPKTGGPGSMWGRAQEALQEGNEDTDDDSCGAAFDGSPPQQHGSSDAKASFGDDNREEGGGSAAPTSRPEKASLENLGGDDDQSAWSAPEFSLEIVGRGGVVGVGSSRGHRRTYAMSAVRRIASSSRHGATPLGDIARRAEADFDDDEDDDSDDDTDDDSDGGGDAAVEEEAAATVRKERVGGAGFAGEGGGREDGGKGKGETPRKPKRRRSRHRRRRTRGFQTISKEEYTPMYVSTARFNVKKNRWESVDGFAVDMSGFDTDDCNGGVHEDDDHSSSLSDPGGRPGPPLLVRDDLSVALGARRGTGGVKEEDGVRHRRAGSGSMSRPSLCRDQSGTSMTSSSGTCIGTPSSQERRRRMPSTSEDGFAAFQLGPKTLQHLAKSEQDHDKAMTRFLGEQGYARAKREGAARLRRLPGIAAVADDEEPSDPSHPSSKRKPARRGSKGSDDSGRGLADARPTGGGGGARGKEKTKATSGASGRADHHRMPRRSLSLFPGASARRAAGTTTSACTTPGTGGSSGGGSGFTTPSGSGSRNPSGRVAARRAAASPSPARDSGSAAEGGAGNSGLSSAGTPLRSRKPPGGGGASPAKGFSPTLARGKQAAAKAAGARRSGSVSRNPRGGSLHEEARKEGASPARASSPYAATARPNGGGGGGSGSASAASTPGRRKGAVARSGASPKTSPAARQAAADSRHASPAPAPAAAAAAAVRGSGDGSRVAGGRRRGNGGVSPNGDGEKGRGKGSMFSLSCFPYRNSSRGEEVATGGRARRSSSDSLAAVTATATAGPSSPFSSSTPSPATTGRLKTPGGRRRHGAAAVTTPVSSSNPRSPSVDVIIGGNLLRRESSPASTGSTGGGGGGGSGSGSRATARTTAVSPRPSSRVLRSPPRRHASGTDRPQRRSSIGSPPSSPRAVRLQRTASSGRLSSGRAGSGLRPRIGGPAEGARRRGEGGAEAEAAAAAVAERERAARRLERFRYMAEFASNTVKERFSLFGGRTSAEVPFTADLPLRRGHRRRRSGGESSIGGASVGSGSSAGLGSMVGLTVWR